MGLFNSGLIIPGKMEPRKIVEEIGTISPKNPVETWDNMIHSIVDSPNATFHRGQSL